MAKEAGRIVELRYEFYQDSFGKVITIAVGICIAIVLLGALSLYLHFQKPAPITFAVGSEFRVIKAVPVDVPYIALPDLLQWVSESLPKAFVYDFSYYDEELKAASRYFTSNGWKIFLNQLNIYANYNTVQTDKLFVNGTVAGAPIVLNQGLLSGRYAWWVQMPININYAGYAPPPSKTLMLQLLIVRVPTVNNLNGVGIENVIVVGGATNQLAENG